MAGNTKIFVFKLKELIYTGIFILLGMLLIVLFLCMFHDNDKNKKKSNKTIASYGEVSATAVSKHTYTDGDYISNLVLNDKTIELTVHIVHSQITGVEITKMDDSVTSMYPLFEEAVSDISSQLASSNSLESVIYPSDCRYTYLLILDAIHAVIS